MDTATTKENQHGQATGSGHKREYVVTALAESVIGMVPGLGLERSMEDLWNDPKVISLLCNVPTIFLGFTEKQLGRSAYGEPMIEVEPLLMTCAEAEAVTMWLTQHCPFLAGLASERVDEVPASDRGESIWWMDYTIMPR